MSFQNTLANVLAENDGAVAVLFLDETGEAVHMACDEISPYQMRIVGAYLGIYLRQMSDITLQAGLGQPQVLHIEKEGLHLYAVPLPDDYYLALVQRRPALCARAWASLEEARDQIAREVFD